MAKCLVCGTELESGAAVCPICGSAQEVKSNPYKLAGEPEDTGYTGGIYDRSKAPGHPIDQPDPMQYGGGEPGMFGGAGAAGMGGSSSGFSGNNGGFGGQNNSYGSDSFSNMQGGGYVEPARVQNKTGAIVAIVLVLLCAVGVGAFFIIKNLSSSPKGVAKEFIEAFEDLDIDKMISLFPSELAKDEDVDSLRSIFQYFSSNGVKVEFKNAKYEVGNAYTPAQVLAVEQSFTDNGYNFTEKIDQVKDVHIKATMEASVMGQSQSQDFNATIVCAKINGKWKIVGAKGLE
ncbi:hypothetical protein SAMN04487934_10135 [Eubacterium ruminantium]|nr:hypothetical protein SAMN04487934_10135 [Eubacterium ruminantium]